MDITVAQRNGYTVISPHGDIDFATATPLKETITGALVDGDVHVVVDLGEVEFIESTGLGALIGSRRRAEALKGSLTLASVRPEVVKVFAITALDHVFTLHPTVDDAVAQAPGTPVR